MLVIGREVGEVIAIEGEIKIVVLGVDGKTIRLGISAPRHIQVHRSEVYRRITAQLQGNAKAS